MVVKPLAEQEESDVRANNAHQGDHENALWLGSGHLTDGAQLRAADDDGQPHEE